MIVPEINVVSFMFIFLNIPEGNHYTVKVNFRCFPNRIICYNVHLKIFNEYYLVIKFEYLILYVFQYLI